MADEQQRTQDLRIRVVKLSEDAAKLKAVLAMALEESAHPEDCGYERQQVCSCWQWEARFLLGADLT